MTAYGNAHHFSMILAEVVPQFFSGPAGIEADFELDQNNKAYMVLRIFDEHTKSPWKYLKNFKQEGIDYFEQRFQKSASFSREARRLFHEGRELVSGQDEIRLAGNALGKEKNALYEAEQSYKQSNITKTQYNNIVRRYKKREQELRFTIASVDPKDIEKGRAMIVEAGEFERKAKILEERPDNYLVPAYRQYDLPNKYHPETKKSIQAFEELHGEHLFDYESRAGLQTRHPKKDMKIIITTFMREDMQRAVLQIPEQLYDMTYVFTREDRVEELRKYIPEGIEIIANPMDIDGIADIRQRCIDNPIIGKGKVWFIDDLTTIGWRDENGKLRKELDGVGMMHLYQQISERLDTYMQVGISARSGNNFVKENQKEIGRAYTTYGLRTDWMEKNNIRFDGMYRKNANIKLYEDFYITLSMLTKGFPNVILYNYYFNYKHNSTGGNSTFRNIALQHEAAEALQEEFPEYVSLVQKEGLWGTEGMKDRTEVKIQWAKAYQQK